MLVQPEIRPILSGTVTADMDFEKQGRRAATNTAFRNENDPNDGLPGPRNDSEREGDQYQLTFEDPEDARNPLNWSKCKKICIVGLLSMMSLTT